MKRFCQGMTVAMAGLFVIGFAVFTASAQELKTASQVMEFSSAKMAGYKTWSADYSQTMGMPGGEMTVDGRMLQKPPHKMWMQLDMPMMGQKGKMTMILGGDGILWQVMEIAGRAQVMKADMNRVLSDTASLTGGKFNPLDKMDPSKLWETSKDAYDFKIVGAGDTGGQRTYVMEGSWKAEALTNRQTAAEAAKTGKMRVMIGRDDGFVHRMEVYDKSLTNVIMAMDFKNLKFNADIPDATFMYQPATNATVRDITAMFEMQVRARLGGSAPAESAPSGAAPPAK
jgi:outer membrane lipoprotein-sorting protein